jgi:hypothetical protein
VYEVIDPPTRSRALREGSFDPFSAISGHLPGWAAKGLQGTGLCLVSHPGASIGKEGEPSIESRSLGTAAIAPARTLGATHSGMAEEQARLIWNERRPGSLKQVRRGSMALTFGRGERSERRTSAPNPRRPRVSRLALNHRGAAVNCLERGTPELGMRDTSWPGFAQ